MTREQRGEPYRRDISPFIVRLSQRPSTLLSAPVTLRRGQLHLIGYVSELWVKHYLRRYAEISDHNSGQVSVFTVREPFYTHFVSISFMYFIRITSLHKYLFIILMSLSGAKGYEV